MSRKSLMGRMGKSSVSLIKFLGPSVLPDNYLFIFPGGRFDTCMRECKVQMRMKEI